MTEDSTAAAAFFARISRELMNEPEELTTLQRMAERAVEVVPACDFCGISLRRKRGRVETVAATSPLADACDRLQYELGEGPCLEAVWDDESYLTQDTSSDGRWPRWGPRVAAEGAGSVLSLRLSTEDETLGALNLYAVGTNAFDRDDVDVALIFASHATTALNAARTVSGLQTALQSRHLIGVAQGILMARYDLTMAQSFEVLRRYSSHTNVKLRDVAQSVVDNSALPDSAGGPGPTA